MTRIAYQGVPGAFSHLAARDLHPDARPIPMADFQAVVRAVLKGRVDLGILPMENSVIGNVAGAQEAVNGVDGVIVASEAEYPIRLCLLALPGASLTTIRWAESHPAALGQCARYLSARRLTPRPVEDTAGAARTIAADRDFTRAAIASAEAAELYGLTILDRDIADAPDNRTRFIVIAPAKRGAAVA